jgi:hypothetical protein
MKTLLMSHKEHIKGYGFISDLYGKTKGFAVLVFVTLVLVIGIVTRGISGDI